MFWCQSGVYQAALNHALKSSQVADDVKFQTPYPKFGIRAFRGYFAPLMRPKIENCFSQVSSY